MDGIDQLQSSSRELNNIYNNLGRYQTAIVTHAFGSGQDLSINSLLKFAPLAENFQQYADDYKNELNKFQKLLNSVQQTVRRQAQLEQQRQAAQQPPPQSQSQTQPQSKPVVTAPTQPISRTAPIKQNGGGNTVKQVQVTATAPITTPVNTQSYSNNVNRGPSKSPLKSSNNTLVSNNNASSTISPNITRKSAPIRNPNILPSSNVNVNTNSNTNQQSATTYYASQQSVVTRIAPQRPVVNTNASSIASKPVSTAPVSTTNANTVIRTVSNPTPPSQPPVVRTYSQPRNPNPTQPSQPKVTQQQQPKPAVVNSAYSSDLIASSHVHDPYAARRENYREQERMRQQRQKPAQLSQEEIKANRRRKKREANKRRKQRKKAEQEQKQQQSLSPQANDNFNDTGFNDNYQQSPQQTQSYGFGDHIDVGFADHDIEDSKDMHDEHQNYEEQSKANQQAQNDYDEQNRFDFVALKDIEKAKRKRNRYSYKYIPSETGFDEVWDGNDKYTTTMLRFQGLYNLREQNEEDQKLVKEHIMQEMKFKAEQVDHTKIRIKKDRSWCIVEVKAPGKFIKDMLKKQKKKNDRIFSMNKENRIRQRQRNMERDNDDGDSDDSDEEIPEQRPIYRVTEYERRNNNQDQNPNEKLYILNFDILNKNCHKALTNLFLRFGDLRCHLEMGITGRDDPYAKVTYKNESDASAVWNFQNYNGDPKQKIQFGSRVLTILYARH